MNSTISRNAETIFLYLDFIRAEPERFACGRRQVRQQGPGFRPRGPGFRPPGRLVRRPPGRPQQGGELRTGQQPEEPVGQRRPRLERGRPEHPQPGHASVGVDVEADLLGHRVAGHGEPVPCVGPQRGAGHQLPAVVAQRRPARGVAHEVRGVQLNDLYRSGARQPYGYPVVAIVAAPGRLPAVAHHLSQPRHEQVGGGGVEHVAAAGDDGAVLQRGQVDGGGQQPRVGDRLAVDPQPGHPAVGEDRQPDVGEPLLDRHVELVAGISGHRAAGNQGRPLRGGQPGRGRVALRPARLDRHLGRVVAGEVRGVDHDAADHAGAAQPHDRAVAVPVAGRLAAPAGLPAVHDLALVTEGVRLEHRVLGFDQVLPVGEQLVVGGDHAAPERTGGQVRPLLGVGVHVSVLVISRLPARRRCDPAPSRGGLALDLERGHVAGRRDAVERHVDDGGDAAGGGRRGGGREALPFGPPWLVDMHVGVDQAGQQDLVRR